MRKEHKMFEHNAYYLFLSLVLLLGFALMLVFSFNLAIQFVILLFVLLTYMGMGLMHHYFNHDLHAKIVLEYVLISTLILTAFLFLNAGRL